MQASSSSRPGGSSTAPPRGLPILSGPPPVVESSSCRQCGKPFNVLFRRSHSCGHCGYEYCSTCLCDGQALMPRKPGQTVDKGPLAEFKSAIGLDDRPTMNGYEVESVCTFCLSNLQVNILRQLPLKRLKDYIAAYDISCVGPKEKEDFIQAIIKARNPTTGCLAPENESHFRRRSVPKQGQPPSSNPSSSSTSTPPRRAAPPPNQQQRAQARPPSTTPTPPRAAPYPQFQPMPRPPSNYTPGNYGNYRPPPQTHPTPNIPGYRPPPQYNARPPQPTTTTATPKPAPPVRQPSPPVPTILSLVALPTTYLSSLGIGTLKAILYENHVRVDFKQVLEKDELVKRVSELVLDERKRLERQRYEEDRLAAEEGASAAPVSTANGHKTSSGEEGAETEGGDIDIDGTSAEKDINGNDKPPTMTSKPAPTGPMPDIERGLCVVCQDEEATLAVTDCGHLCMCAHCSDLIMATSQECPLCRTRIITKQRLIRIFRV